MKMNVHIMDLNDSEYHNIHYISNNDFYYIDIEKAITEKHHIVDVADDDKCKLQKEINENNLRGFVKLQKSQYTYTFNYIYPLSREQYVDNFKIFKLNQCERLKSSIKYDEDYIIENKEKIEKLNKEIKLIEKKKYKLSKVMIKESLKYRGKRLTNILKLPLQGSIDFVLKNNVFKDEDEIIECYRALNIDEKLASIDYTKDHLDKLHYGIYKSENLLKNLKNKKLLMVVNEFS
jgi:hypothetical protein